jgi:hypothetical protein
MLFSKSKKQFGHSFDWDLLLLNKRGIERLFSHWDKQQQGRYFLFIEVRGGERQVSGSKSGPINIQLVNVIIVFLGPSWKVDFIKFYLGVRSGKLIFRFKSFDFLS